MIKIEVQSTRAVIRFQEALTVGLRGAKVSFAFGQDWENLSKTAVFRQADRTVSVAAEPETVIPWEVLTMPGVPVQIGVYGVDSTGAVAIPTVWAVTQPVRPGTDPEGDPALEPTPGLWEQMQGKLTELEAALENTQAPVYTVTVRKNEDGSYWADKSPEDRADAYLAGKMLMCHWTEYNLLLPLSHTSGRRTFVFRTVKDGSEYCVEMTEDIQCTRKALEAEAPVQSVNGQTGDVVLPTPLKVTVSQGTEGDYFADTDPDFIQEALDHNRTLVCCWQEKNVMLPLTSFRQGGPYSFTAVTGEQEYSVTIYDTENIACTVTKLSPEAVLYTPQELTPEQQTQARQNIGAIEAPETAETGQTIVVKEVDENGKPTAWEAADFPAGGSGSQNFSVVETIEKEVTSYTVLLPVNLGKALIFNVHITFPSVETEFKLLCSSGQSGYVGWTIPVNSREVGANLYAVRHSEIKSNSGTTVAKDYTYAARPELSATGWLNSSGMHNTLSLHANADGVELPAGTKIEVWGICE